MFMERKARAMHIAGYKKSGKTTLLCRLTEHYARQGVRIATVKHDGHGFEPDVPGTDTWRHRRAGAVATAIVSPACTALFEERPRSLADVVARLEAGCDLILIEGWKLDGAYPKLALVQAAEHAELLGEMPRLRGIASWDETLRGRLAAASGVPVFDYEDTAAIAAFVWAEALPIDGKA